MKHLILCAALALSACNVGPNPNGTAQVECGSDLYSVSNVRVQKVDDLYKITDPATGDVVFVPVARCAIHYINAQ